MNVSAKALAEATVRAKAVRATILFTWFLQWYSCSGRIIALGLLGLCHGFVKCGPLPSLFVLRKFFERWGLGPDLLFVGDHLAEVGYVVLDAFDLGGPVGEVAFVGDAGGGFALGFGEGFEGVGEFLLEGGAGHGGRLSLLAEIPQGRH